MLGFFKFPQWAWHAVAVEPEQERTTVSEERVAVPAVPAKRLAVVEDDGGQLPVVRIEELEADVTRTHAPESGQGFDRHGGPQAVEFGRIGKVGQNHAVDGTGGADGLRNFYTGGVLQNGVQR